MLGLTGVALTFTLLNVTDAAVGAPVVGTGEAGPYMQMAGRVPYYRVGFLVGQIHIVVDGFVNSVKHFFHTCTTTIKRASRSIE